MREVIDVIGRALNVPVVSIRKEEAGDYYGPLAMFAGLDMPASSVLTQQRLGWTPTGIGLIADIGRPGARRAQHIPDGLAAGHVPAGVGSVIAGQRNQQAQPQHRHHPAPEPGDGRMPPGGGDKCKHHVPRRRRLSLGPFLISAGPDAIRGRFCFCKRVSPER